MTQTAPENAGSYKKKSRKSAGQLNSSLYLQAKSSYDNDEFDSESVSDDTNDEFEILVVNVKKSCPDDLLKKLAAVHQFIKS